MLHPCLAISNIGLTKNNRKNQSGFLTNGDLQLNYLAVWLNVKTKNSIMNNLLSILKALSDRNRLRTVAALMSYDELCACQITELLKVRGATASRHLGQLVNAGILKNRKDGRWIYYRLNKSNAIIRPGIDWIKTEFGDDEELAGDRDELERIIACDPEDICRKQRGEACCPRKKEN